MRILLICLMLLGCVGAVGAEEYKNMEEVLEPRNLTSEEVELYKSAINITDIKFTTENLSPFQWEMRQNLTSNCPPDDTQCWQNVELHKYICSQDNTIFRLELENQELKEALKLAWKWLNSDYGLFNGVNLGKYPKCQEELSDLAKIKEVLNVD
jgi:hypothetical protein